MTRSLTVAVLAATFLLACSADTIQRAEWERMPEEDRILYVKSLIGEERAKEAKGGGGRTYDRSAEDYAVMIDEAYARGDRRDAREIFADLGETR